MHGWTGRILKINLTEKRFETISLPQDIYRRFLGGKGLAGYFLARRAYLEWNAPQMPILLMTGPLAGTGAPASGNTVIASRSPLTGTVSDSSVGGALGAKLKSAGVDGIVVEGMSDAWLGIEIHNQTVRFVSASSLCGQPLSRIADQLETKGAFAAVGNAAENGVRFAAVMIDRHFSTARGGLGGCFAAKRLKYITVEGTGHVSVADNTVCKTAREDIRRLTAASSILMGEHGFFNLGTSALYDLVYSRRMMPTANFRRTVFDSAPLLNANAVRRTYGMQRFGCEGCLVQCLKNSENGMQLPDFDTLAHFTALIENRDLHTAVEAATACSEQGIDTVSAAATLACYAEIKNESLTTDRILGLLEDLGAGRGEGEILAKGSFRAARELGRPECAMTVKRLELPAFDPRGAYGMALAYATSTRGGCYANATALSHEILRKPVATDRFSFSAKARIIKIAEDQNAAVDSLVACKYLFFAASLEEYARVLSGVTGELFTATELSRIGERIVYIERITNMHFGVLGEDDTLPNRFFTEDGSSGPGFAIPRINRREFDDALSRYRRVRELLEDGTPKKEKAERLEIEWNN
ncbi:MAG: aldehyde ferredoxin oxidoreductase [Deltaproteobacteria bacterium]|nr:aldehyde ferredoxin oxidoreductase [Deltaproteobacteria bacterium]MBN2670639.1 aldehyde ferredoxin oxidoreductase [Deltaproteobacteria bacterium]